MSSEDLSWARLVLSAGGARRLDAALGDVVGPVLDGSDVAAWSFTRVNSGDGLRIELLAGAPSWTDAARRELVAALAEGLPAAARSTPRETLLPVPPSDDGTPAIGVEDLGEAPAPRELDVVSSRVALAVAPQLAKPEDRAAFALAALGAVGGSSEAWASRADALLGSGEAADRLRSGLADEAARLGPVLRERARAHRGDVRRAELLRALHDAAGDTSPEDVHLVANRLGASPVEEALLCLLLAASDPEESAPEPAVPVLRFAGVTKEGEDATVVDGVELEVHRGEVFGLLGPIEAGKSTLLGLAAGLRVPDDGTLEVLGQDPLEDRPALAGRVAVPLPDAELADASTVREQLELAAKNRGDDVDGALRGAALAGRAGTLTGELSPGERRRLAIATALLSEPELLLIDGPTGGLSAVDREEVWQLLRERRTLGGTTVLASESVQDALAVCDRVALLVGGAVVALGPPQEVVAAHFPQRSVTFITSDEPDLALVNDLPEVTDIRFDQRADHWSITADVLQPDQLLAVLGADPSFPDVVRVAEEDLEATFAHPRGSTEAEENET